MQGEIMEEKRLKRTFTEEFKEEAIRLAKRDGNIKAAAALGISEASIRNWRKKQEFQGNMPDRPQTKRSYDDIERENRKLQKENEYLKEINKVLKKAQQSFRSTRWAVSDDWETK